ESLSSRALRLKAASRSTASDFLCGLCALGFSALRSLPTFQESLHPRQHTLPALRVFECSLVIRPEPLLRHPHQRSGSNLLWPLRLQPRSRLLSQLPPHPRLHPPPPPRNPRMHQHPRRIYSQIPTIDTKRGSTRPRPDTRPLPADPNVSFPLGDPIQPFLPP